MLFVVMCPKGATILCVQISTFPVTSAEGRCRGVKTDYIMEMAHSFERHF
jgi:hypothetical protein